MPTHAMRLHEWGTRRVVIQDAVIEYDDGPVIVQDVYFVNCTFRVAQQPKGMMFADSILKSPKVDFKG